MNLIFISIINVSVNYFNDGGKNMSGPIEHLTSVTPFILGNK